jgi:hypothetical protein
MSQGNLDHRKRQAFKRVVVPILIATMMLLSVQAVLAYLDRVILQDYIVDLVNYEVNGNQSTWVYAVTYNTDGPTEDPPALSHWMLGMDLSCYEIIIPEEEKTYTTPTDSQYECGATYTCTQATYNEIEYGSDPTLGLMSGVKWGDVIAGPQVSLATPDTQIFVLTVEADEHRIGEIPVGVKYGNQYNITGTIMGPVCSPNAVEMTAVSANSGGIAPPILLMLTLALGGLGYASLRHTQKIDHA